MSELSRRINEFFRYATRDEVTDITGRVIFTERQMRIFDMKYLKGHDVNFIADSLFVSPKVIEKELRTIRDKIARVIG